MFQRFFVSIMLVLAVVCAPAHGRVNQIKQQLELSATTTSAQALDQNVSRQYLLVSNKGTAAVLVKFKTAHTASEGIYIPAGGNYEPQFVPSESVFIKSTTGTQSVTVVEGE